MFTVQLRQVRAIIPGIRTAIYRKFHTCIQTQNDVVLIIRQYFRCRWNYRIRIVYPHLEGVGREGRFSCLCPDLIDIRSQPGYYGSFYCLPSSLTALPVFHIQRNVLQSAIVCISIGSVGDRHPDRRRPTGRHVQHLCCAVLRCRVIALFHDA
ncbi:hypothetical protein D3C75_527200 [compost metagenome]